MADCIAYIASSYRFCHRLNASQVLKQVHPDIGMSQLAMKVTNDL